LCLRSADAGTPTDTLVIGLHIGSTDWTYLLPNCFMPAGRDRANELPATVGREGEIARRVAIAALISSTWSDAGGGSPAVTSAESLDGFSKHNKTRQDEAPEVLDGAEGA
jgi:hypothetical protein